MESKQVQKAGDGSQQVQIVNSPIVLGIDEKRVREVCSEMALEIIKQCTAEAAAIATSRIENFTTNLISRVEKIEKDFKSFSEPSFQFELRNAQKVAACTDRVEDYEMLSELLVHSIEKGDDRKTKASISKAIEIVDQIDNEALCALTLVYAIKNWVPLSGNITEGLCLMNDLLSSLCYRDLPNNFDWALHLDILNAVRVSSIGKFSGFCNYYSEIFQGYTCVGIQKDSDDYQRAIKILNEANLPASLLVDHELNSGYVRLNVINKDNIKDITIPILVDQNVIQLKKATNKDVESLNKIWNMYSNNTNSKEIVKKTFMEKWDSYNSLKTVHLWWDALPNSIMITPIGKVLAHANAQRYNENIPQIDFN